MAEATLKTRIDSNQPGMQIAQITASTTETFTSHFKIVDGCIIGYNPTTFTDEKCTAAIGTQAVTLEMIGTDTTDVDLSIMVVGRE